MIALANDSVFRARSSRVASAVEAARVAQQTWAETSIHVRARFAGELRHTLAAHAEELAHAAASIHHRPIAEKLVSEVLPLIEACRFLEKNAAGILRTKKFGRRGRPVWLHGSSFEVQRKPHGVVLIVGPSNYPLFLPCVQAVHALVAGNAVLIKPAEGASQPVARFIELLSCASDLVQLLPERIDAGHEAVECGIDKAIFTGSSTNGRDFLADLAATNTPSVMELSGADFVFVRHDANVQLAARAIAFGVRLNAGNTCMAPHTIVVHRPLAGALISALREERISEPSMLIVASDDEALEIAHVEEHGLGAAIFSCDEKAARRFASQLQTGFVTINDVIVPTADPRFPFGGVRASGFGVTRGEEGLREMTYPHVVALRRARFLPHLRPPCESDAQLFLASIALLHARGWRSRFRALAQFWRAARTRKRS